MRVADHSRGQWRLGEREEAELVGRIPIHAGHHYAFAEAVWQMDGDERSPHCEANAHLMVASPELLKELRDLVLRCDGAEGVRADGSNIDTRSAHALLERIGGWP